MKIHIICKLLAVAALALGMAGSAFGQTPVRHMQLIYESEPTGPNQTFYVRLIMQEHDTDISGYQLRIGYADSRGTFTAISNNLGPNGAGSGAVFSIGTFEIPLAGVSYADTYRKILLDTSGNILPPALPTTDFDLGRLQFVTSADYDPTDGKFGIYIESDTAGSGVWNGMLQSIPVEFISLDPTSAVSDWSMY